MLLSDQADQDPGGIFGRWQQRHAGPANGAEASQRLGDGVREPYWGRNPGCWHPDAGQNATWALQGDYTRVGELQTMPKFPRGAHFGASTKKEEEPRAR